MERITLDRPTHLEAPEFEVVEVSPGLGFGDGMISGQAAPEVAQQTEDIVHHERDILVPISLSKDGAPIEDDGCADGRGVGTIFTNAEEFNKNLHRPKVFGGAATMTAAIMIGSGIYKDKELDWVFAAAITELEGAGLDFGAHTDEYAGGENCGCGAIDRAPEALRAVQEYRQPIAETVEALSQVEGLDIDTSELPEVLDNFEQYREAGLARTADFAGQLMMGKIIDRAKVVKQLVGDHREKRIVFNTIPDFTVNQELVRQKTNGLAQIFVADLPRLTTIAERITEGNPEYAKRALLSELVYSLGVSGVLTKGDLPVDIIRAKAA